ncbi:MAG: hypothetical protein ACM32E_28155 [Gemmatimonadota bacterium]
MVQPRDAVAVQVPAGVLLTRRGSALVLLAVELAQRTAAARDGGGHQHRTW